MRVLVTGADGFVGKHLVAELLNHGHQVFAGLQQTHTGFGNEVETRIFDLLDPDSIADLIQVSHPDGIVHLAALSMVKLAWKEPAQAILVNTLGTVHLIQAMIRYAPAAKLLFIGSSEEYGLAGVQGSPLREDDPCLPQNPYAVSKLAAGQLALQIGAKEHINILHLRPFNHFGPGQAEGYVVSDFAAQIARIEKGIVPPIIKVGDLTARRDFTDVRDVVAAYRLLLENPVAPGIYNVCSGHPRAAQEILEKFLKLTASTIEIQVDPDRFQPATVPVFSGSFTKLNQAVGWAPQRDFDQSLRETLEWRRNTKLHSTM